MDYQNYQRPTRNPNRCLWMENISVMLGVMSLLSIWLVYPPFICGSMAIVFALLSKGGERSITARARTGLILGFIALAAMVCMFIYVINILDAIYGNLWSFPVDSSGNVDAGQLLTDLYGYLGMY